MCPKTESTVFKVSVIVCGVDSLCRLVAFRFFFLFASVCPRHVLALRVLSQCSVACLHGLVPWSLSKRSVGVSSRLFLGMQHRVQWVRRHVGLRHVDRMNEKG